MLPTDSIALGYIEHYGPVSTHSIKEYLIRQATGIRRCNADAETRRSINRLVEAQEIENVGESKYDIRRD